MFESTPEMRPEEYRELRDLLYKTAGLAFDDDAKFLMERRLQKRLAALQLPNYREYVLYLKFGPDREEELGTMIELLTTNETYFFREAFQLRAFQEEILPEIRERKSREGTREVRIWSAGCSTGEEPYTIAILLLDSGVFPAREGWKVEVFASDISQQVLGAARHGAYGRASFRVTEDRYLRRYFEPAEGPPAPLALQGGSPGRATPTGRWRVRDEVRAIVRFGHLNLMDALRLRLLPQMDVIFCRNVLIYFDLRSKQPVISSFYERLAGGGYLLLGHAESLMNVTTVFSLRQLRNDLVYQKEGAEPPRPDDRRHLREHGS